MNLRDVPDMVWLIFALTMVVGAYASLRVWAVSEPGPLDELMLILGGAVATAFGVGRRQQP